jgi:Amt family ammonium transporter
MDIFWMLCAAMLVFVMQAGFLCLESGLVRSKNSINVAAKNISDFTISSMIFWAVGFAIMFGDSVSGLFGTHYFFFGDGASPHLIAIFLFQMMFCGTAATLVSGAVAERMSYIGYIIITITITLFIYPWVGHWVWAGIVSNQPTGWLEVLGFVDFAGSTVVHSVGGWVALAAILIIGPRIGRYDNKTNRIPGSNLPMAILGGMLIWFGWFGFNGGSTLAWTDSVPAILLNTCLAAFWGGLLSTLLKYITDGYIDVVYIMNGVLGGLVAITANCHAVSVKEAVFIGLVAGIIVFYGERWLERKKIDDAIGVIPVHLFSGIWGTLAVALFGDSLLLGTGLTQFEQLKVQILGIVVIGLFTFITAYIIFKTVNRFYPLRVDQRSELVGLNVAEHQVSTEVYDLLSAMNRQQEKADFSSQVPVEPFTEVGQIAQKYNHVIDKVNQEIQQRDNAFSAFKQSEFRKGAILDAAMDSIISINMRGEIKEFNRAAEQCFGVSFNRIKNKNFFSTFVAEKYRNLHFQNLSQGFTMSDGLVLNRQNISELMRFDQESFSAEVVITQTNDQHNKDKEFTFHIRDITKQIKLQNRLKLLAYNDPLTGLYNRTYFMTNLEKRINYHKLVNGNVVLMFLDLDQFKKVNDTLGHKAGDELLCEVANRLTAVTRDNDLVGRWGGDEFVVVMSGNLTESSTKEKAKNILNAMREPVEITDNTLTVLTSIGIAISRNGEVNADRLLQHADLAMYQAKEAGRNTYRLFSKEMEDTANQNFQYETALPMAMKTEQLFLQFQPKVNCLTNEVVGFEALIRWQHPTNGFIPPSDFIPVIEQSNLIVDIGEWVLRKTVEQLVEWRKLGLPLLPIAVNISGRHLHDPSLAIFITSLTDKHKIGPELIELEITEGVLTGNTEQSIAAMNSLKQTGIKLAIDDFGTGYSSLSYLKKFPVDILKIDRSFINECDTNKDDAAICLAIVTLAKNLGLQIVAEGVETLEQLNYLNELSCHVYQGYYFSKPLNPEHIPVLLQQVNSN